MGFDGEMGTLLHLGLTNSQAKVYLALLRIGADCKGTTIAQFADVPRQDVYRLLAELEQIGIISKTLTRPTKYKAASAKETIEILLNRKMDDFSKLKREGNLFVTKIEENLVPQNFSEDEVVIISGRDAILAKIREASLRSQVSSRIIVPYNELVPWLSLLSQSEDEGLSRGVEHRYITEKTAMSQLSPLVRHYVDVPNFKLRFINQPIKAKLSLFDGNEVFIGMFTGSAFTVSPALYSNNSSIVAVAESYFEACWKRGTDVDQHTFEKPNLKVKNPDLTR